MGGNGLLGVNKNKTNLAKTEAGNIFFMFLISLFAFKIVVGNGAVYLEEVTIAEFDSGNERKVPQVHVSKYICVSTVPYKIEDVGVILSDITAYLWLSNMITTLLCLHAYNIHEHVTQHT